MAGATKDVPRADSLDRDLAGEFGSCGQCDCLDPASPRRRDATGAAAQLLQSLSPVAAVSWWLMFVAVRFCLGVSTTAASEGSSPTTTSAGFAVRKGASR